MRRREFLAALVSSGVFSSDSSGSVRYPVHFRKSNPYDSAVSHVDPGTDEFPFEKEAQQIESRLRAILRGQALPLAGDFAGRAPMARRYKPVAEGVSEAEFGDGDFQQWIASLGRVRRANFFVLPGNMILQSGRSAELALPFRGRYFRANHSVSARLHRKAVEADPKSADAANQLGLACAKQSRNTEAKLWFEKAIAIHRDHAGAIKNLAVLYAELGQSNDAIAAFRYGIEVAPEDDELYLNLGRLYVQMGDREKARDLMRQLLAKKPGDAVATRGLRELDSR